MMHAEWDEYKEAHREYCMPINLSEKEDDSNLRNARVIFFSILLEIQLFFFWARPLRIRPSSILRSVKISKIFLSFLEGESIQTIVRRRTVRKKLKAENMLSMIRMNTKANGGSLIMGM